MRRQTVAHLVLVLCAAGLGWSIGALVAVVLG
jgi:hypothetical protein